MARRGGGRRALNRLAARASAGKGLSKGVSFFAVKSAFVHPPEESRRRSLAEPAVSPAGQKERGPGESFPDDELVARILSGEEGLFEVLVRRYQARMLGHVSRMVGNREDALDLTQEIFIKVFQALHRYNAQYKFSTWIFRIAGNTAIDHLRKRRPRTIPLEPSPSDFHREVSSVEYKSAEPDPYGKLRNAERGEAISRAIGDLPEEFRELITLRHFTGLSYEEIAQVKEMPLGTVKNKLFRARAVLKERLSGELS